MSDSKLSPTDTKPAELRAPTHKRAKRAAALIDKPLVDLVSDAADQVARPILRRFGLDDDCQPVSRTHKTIVQ